MPALRRLYAAPMGNSEPGRHGDTQSRHSPRKSFSATGDQFRHFCEAHFSGDPLQLLRRISRTLHRRLDKIALIQTIRFTGRLQISRGAFRNLNLAHQPVSDRGHGFDETRLVDVVAQQAAQQPDATRKGTLCNGGIAPYGIKQFFLRDYLWGSAAIVGGRETPLARPPTPFPP